MLRAAGETPLLTLHAFGRGQAAYLGGFRYSPRSARMLLELLLYLTGRQGSEAGITDHPLAECAWFPTSDTLVLMSSAEEELTVTVTLPFGTVRAALAPCQTLFLPVEAPMT